MEKGKVKDLLDFYHDKYNAINFIESDPISIPHLFTKKQDIEISGFFAATLAWGQRKTIIANAKSIIERMDNHPYDFIMNHQEKDLKRFLGFKHRTFNDTDLLYFIFFFKSVYKEHDSLEEIFYSKSENIEFGLNNFYQKFISLDSFPDRTKKHVASPKKKSACKRLNMYLRWMVRKDERGVDFGIWNKIKMADLHIPLDVHVEKTARKFGLLQRKQVDWYAVVELTEVLRQFNSEDPVRYDFALFGMSIESKIL